MPPRKRKVHEPLAVSFEAPIGGDVALRGGGVYNEAKKRYRCRVVGLAVEDEAVRSGLLKIRRRMCGCPPCSPPNFNFGQCVLKYVDALPSEAEAPRCPHADPGACRVLRVARRERGVRGQGG